MQIPRTGVIKYLHQHHTASDWLSPSPDTVPWAVSTTLHVLSVRARITREPHMAALPGVWFIPLTRVQAPRRSNSEQFLCIFPVPSIGHGTWHMLEDCLLKDGTSGPEIFIRKQGLLSCTDGLRTSPARLYHSNQANLKVLQDMVQGTLNMTLCHLCLASSAFTAQGPALDLRTLCRIWHPW